MTALRSCFMVLMFAAATGVGYAQEPLLSDGEISFNGLQEAGQMSAIDMVHDYYLIGVDEAVDGDDGEANVIQLFAKAGSGNFERRSSIALCQSGSAAGCSDPERNEMDIEALAVDGATVYIIGSHSVARRRLDEDKKYKRNRKRITAGSVAAADDGNKHAWKAATGRDRLVRLTIDAQGNPSGLEETSLTGVISALTALKPFQTLPSKENGVDIEAMAIRGGKLHIGFRGPVLRGGYTPVLKADFELLAEAEQQIDADDLLFVQLDGLGIRSMTTVSTGFLIVAGPVGDAPGPYQLFHWDGLDTIPGKKSPGGKSVLLGEIQTSGGKPEGLVLLEETATDYRIAIVEDGAETPVARLFAVPKQ